MRRLELFALVLAFLLTLSACGGTEEPDAMRDPPPQDGGEDVTLYDCGGLEVNADVLFSPDGRMEAGQEVYLQIPRKDILELR